MNIRFLLNEKVQTAAAKCEDENITIYVNPDFVERYRLDKDGFIALVKHELLHALYAASCGKSKSLDSKVLGLFESECLRLFHQEKK